MDNQEQLFILISPKELKDDLVDALMAMTQITGFNLKKIHGYSKTHSHFNMSEQVEGYRTLYQFEVLVKTTDKTSFIHHLTPICKSEKLKYWFLPISESNHF
jgi:hypothetical protein